MGWAIDFNFNIHINKPEGGLENNIERVKDKIEESNNDIKYIEEKLKMYSISRPRDIIITNKEETNLIDEINVELNDLFDWYKDTIQEKLKWEYYLEYLETKQNNKN